jgi:hypothetical protein
MVRPSWRGDGVHDEAQGQGEATGAARFGGVPLGDGLTPVLLLVAEHPVAVGDGALKLQAGVGGVCATGGLEAPELAGEREG